MKTFFTQPWVYVLIAIAIVVGLATFLLRPQNRHPQPSSTRFEKPFREHMEHAHLVNGPFATGQEVTAECLKCHPDAARDMMKTAHWKWVGAEVEVPDHKGKHRIGKRNLINNFCIGIQGNWASCTRCHAGYGWEDDSFDFESETSVDCLVCHDGTGSYQKGAAGNPKKEVNLEAVAKSVGYPKRNNCGLCHNFGGGGMGVKHGDLDASLNHPMENDDVHMGKLDFLCIDCHQTRKHDIPGKSMSVSVNQENGVFCTKCHAEAPHADARINAHVNSVACETCHIPSYARRNPTKTHWDWSKAGDSTRPEDPHHYLKIKGEFQYANDIIPEYRWYNGTAARYLLGDKIDPSLVTAINRPLGSIRDKRAKIYPFKVHYAVQPYDVGNLTLVVPTTSGDGGYWHDFDWDKAFALGAKATGLAYSGKFGFTNTEMYWPLSHMVTPKADALTCNDCHSDTGRLNWEALGYEGDPIETGGRK
ncbi:MAG: tetrathionate reductase family octaheme c-type cytochrome [Deltaproteobacteria bacterium]|nr:tetrathionate reductase family octaheme c-type cytochrome [Deltaproteobacteria bacterium]MBN2671642.1 tetrathionate reductase family octaheme c-type cytochrome [Deltaproteobacteria bacterium]